MLALHHDNEEVKRQAQKFREERNLLQEEARADREASRVSQEKLQEEVDTNLRR